MSDSVTKKMLRLFEQRISPTMFFAGLFQAPAENYYNSEEVELDIIRSDEEVAVAVQDLKAGYRHNTTDLYTNKSFKPPVYKESFSINSFELLKRQAGDDPFENPGFRANLISRFLGGTRTVTDKIRRSMELQGAQALQTGKVTLTDISGNAVYAIDYKPKSTHFPDAGTAWSSATTAQKIADISALADVVRDDGLEDPDQLIIGEDAFRYFTLDEGIQKLLDVRNYDFGGIGGGDMRGRGAKYRGRITLDSYTYDIWTYNGRYKDPQSGNKVRYMDKNKVIVRSSTGLLNATFGAVPNIGALLGVGTRVLPEVSRRFKSTAQGFDATTNVWLSEDNETLFGGVAARPLMIPSAIDTFGCVNTAP